MEDRDIYKKAAERAEAKIGFYTHLAVYVVVNLLLVVVNLWTSPDHYWFQWPLLGWGIGVFFHGLDVFILSGETGIKERMIEKEMEKLERRKRPPH